MSQPDLGVQLYQEEVVKKSNGAAVHIEGIARRTCSQTNVQGSPWGTVP